MEALKPLKRAAEKERRRANRKALREKANAGLLSLEEQALVDSRKQLRQARRGARGLAEADMQGDWKGGVVVDLGFDDCMTDQEIISMTTQLGRLYSSNRTASRSVATVLHTSFSPNASPRLWEKMRKSNWEKWTRSSWWGLGLDELVKAFKDHPDHIQSDSFTPTDTKPSETDLMMNSSTALNTDRSAANGKGNPSDLIGDGTDTDLLLSNLSHPHLPSPFTSKYKLVYLSADSEEELTTLSEDEIYIIGGLVDRNRFKNICQDKADKLGIRTARLPIGTYLQNLPTRKVLTVNQVFEILVNYIATQSWKEAFEAVMPQRKFNVGKPRKYNKDDGEDGVGDDGDGDEVEQVGNIATADEIDEEAALNA
ncbi:guanine-1-methyltransferase-domain-containing protein [Naematelia encephala]|uniref:tRNA (guanine(9)-N1)-methyltransferase n=1 Tax=Naematelia encephala TaxID=71784 RepID=A0A1Y2B1D3_9TREE|nr:guanine-1-methyltransferase-domain-containing protein [Naematelia encephala]